MNKQLDEFIGYIDLAKNDLNVQRQIAFELECNSITLDIIDKSIALAEKLKSIAVSGNYKINYLNQFRSNFDNILNTIPLRGHKNSNIVNQQDDRWKTQVKEQFDNNTIQVSNFYNQLSAQLI